MKIIKKGKPPSEQVYRGTCYYCGCVVECTQAEVKSGGEDPRDGYSYNYVKCPTCGKDLGVEKKGKGK